MEQVVEATITFPQDPISYVAPSWADIHRYVFLLAQHIARDIASFDALVTMACGGFPGVSMLKDFLQVSPVLSLGIKSYTGVGEQGKTVVFQGISTSLKDKHILLFDDVTDTGTTMEYAKTYLRNKGVASLTTATIYHKPHSVCIPDYFVIETTSWVIFPHDLVETAKQLSVRWQKHGYPPTSSEVGERFDKLGIPQSWVKTHLAHPA